MKISSNWIREYALTGLSVDEISEILTSTGLEVETVEAWQSIKGGLSGVVSGKVITCEKHPDADKLKVCRVDVADDQGLLNIVCGAPNVEAGQMVWVARVGAVLFPTGAQEPLEIKKAKIRGIVSEGMICAEDELGIGTSHAGIMVLPDGFQTGIPAASYYNVVTDQIFEVGLTPNRSDAMSHIGVARDLLAALSFRRKLTLSLSLPEVSHPKSISGSLPVKVMIENGDACRRYTGITIRGVKVAASPDWLMNRLKSIGIKPINNVVDITNFVLHETGHPLHAFDYDQIEGAAIVVKNMPEGTPFVTLDGIERRLLADDLMICDTRKPLCIAGVYGGMHSGVTDETRNLFLESAWFDPVSVRKTARAHQLNTDASFRFERGADPAITRYALLRAVQLICEITGGNVSSDICDEGDYAANLPVAIVEVHFEKVCQVAGVSISPSDIRAILNLLDFNIVSSDSAKLTVTVPTCRADVTREIDIIEEILRIYGIDQIPIPSAIPVAFPVVAENPGSRLVDTFSHYLVSNGFYEVMNNSLSSARYQVAANDASSQLSPVTLLNPLSTDLDTLRTSMLPGLLENIRHNLHRQNPDAKLFEIGYTYGTHLGVSMDKPVDERFAESHQLALVITGKSAVESWRRPQSDADFFDLKASVDGLLSLAGFNESNCVYDELADQTFSMGTVIRHSGHELVRFGQLNLEYLKLFQIKQPVFYAGFCLQTIVEHLPSRKSTTSLPKYPGVRRDLSLIISKEVQYSTIRNIILKTDPLIRSVNLFDVFSSDALPPGKISYAVSFTIRHDEKTLSDEEIDKILSRVINALSQRAGAVLR